MTKMTLEKLHRRRYGGYFYTSLHNRSARNIFHLALSRQRIYKAAKGFSPRLSKPELRLCCEPAFVHAHTPQPPHANGLVLLATNFCHNSSAQQPAAAFPGTNASVCTNRILARDPFIKMPSAHFGAADLNFNPFCYEANLSG